jgi:O-antigen/teichoic acid export membrane protein
VSSIDAERTYEFRTTGLSRIAVTGVLWSLVMSVAPSLVAALVFLFTSRSLGPKEFGLVALASAIATIAGALAPVGFGQAIVQHKVIERRHLDSVFWLCVATSVVFYALVVALAAPLAGAFREPLLLGLLPVLGLRIIFDLAGTVPRAVLGRTMSFDKMAVRTTVASVFGGAVCLGALWLGYGLWALALSQLTLSFTAAAGSILAARWWPRLHFDRDAIRELAHFASRCCSACCRSWACGSSSISPAPCHAPSLAGPCRSTRWRCGPPSPPSSAVWCAWARYGWAMDCGRWRCRN